MLVCRMLRRHAVPQRCSAPANELLEGAAAPQPLASSLARGLRRALRAIRAATTPRLPVSSSRSRRRQPGSTPQAIIPLTTDTTPTCRTGERSHTLTARCQHAELALCMIVPCSAPNSPMPLSSLRPVCGGDGVPTPHLLNSITHPGTQPTTPRATTHT